MFHQLIQGGALWSLMNGVTTYNLQVYNPFPIPKDSLTKWVNYRVITTPFLSGMMSFHPVPPKPTFFRSKFHLPKVTQTNKERKEAACASSSLRFAWHGVFQPRKKSHAGKTAGKPGGGDLPTTWFAYMVFLGLWGHEHNDRRGEILYDIRSLMFCLGFTRMYYTFPRKSLTITCAACFIAPKTSKFDYSCLHFFISKQNL